MRCASRKREVLLISPYFVPGRAGLALLRELSRARRAGRVVTNSLAATDVVAVHGGYAKYRRALLDAGVELFELKPGAGRAREPARLARRGAAHQGLGGGRARAFVGSFNLDPRSAALNTEMGAFVQHQAVAQDVAAEHARLADPALSWQVVWQNGALRWRDGDADAKVMLRREPSAGWWRRALAWLVRRLPLEEQL